MTPIPLSEFADQLSEIMPTIVREFFKRQAGEIIKGNVTPPQLLILDFLGKQGESKMKDLAQFMDVTTATMTGIVERLVRDNFLERVYEPADRRIVKVKLTSKGASLVRKFHDAKREMILNTFGRISPKDREDYLRILTQVKEILTQKAIA